MAASVSGVSQIETVAKNWVVLLCCLCRSNESSLTEVVATFEVGNIASRNVLEKSGFVDHGTMRCYGEDGPNYRITRDGWLELQQSA
jgi:RimJ/RimL family protein N-acetyltransferase